jgi:tetratricopeptide (TPR) repeat protein
MTEIDIELLEKLYAKFEAGNRVEALEELRDLAQRLDDPSDRAVLLYHEILLLAEMDETSQARLLLEEFKGTVASLAGPPPDAYQNDDPISLTVMAQYAEVKVLLAERNEPLALGALEELESRYPKYLSTPECWEIERDLQVQHGYLLGDAGRWREAKPFLENAFPPDAWKSVTCYYLGHCYYELHEYERAKVKLVEALDRGLVGQWEGKAHYVLGIVEYHLSDLKASKTQFELCV